ncbi:F0F1 ATP synthase subunit delta [Photobacterium rosenbergii]|uniref:F0F1 ATP synthase subunit delta n=1 Tax=Photobacterium rosenbergii TaxID=294936 RepID=UPI001C99E8F5|nr:F0F1 ATP synthase subunit delta [Photobacterium rosenbergii]MBY5947794.1 F0F1 ATP synthase subunit delta [Photobacterium rosenbergii]
MSDEKSIARPYAKAAFEFAKDHDSMASWSDMLALASQVFDELQASEALASVSDKAVWSQIVIDVCGENIDPFFTNFLKIIADNDRLFLIPDIKASFEEIVASFQRSKLVSVTVAEPLQLSQAENLTKALEAKYQCSIELDIDVDEELMGGMVLKDGETVLDGSIKHAVDSLSSRLHS